MSGPRVPRDPVSAVEDIVNAYLANEYRPDESTVCALDREEWSSALCYVYGVVSQLVLRRAKRR